MWRPRVLAALVVTAAASGCGDDSEIALHTGSSADAALGGRAGVSFCSSSADCGGERPFCDTAAHRCVACLLTSHCYDGLVCDAITHQCTQTCSSTIGCTGDLSMCDLSRGVCVQCVTDADCGSTEGKHCVASRCVECTKDIDCLDPQRRFCDVFSGYCRQCLNNAQCASGQTCNQYEYQCTG